MVSDLKPCPFCGSDRVTVWNIRDGQQAVCKDCKSTGVPTFHGPEGHEATHGKAVEAWNNRAALAQEEAEAVRVKVRALEWDPFRAETLFGYYHIDDQRDHSFEELLGRPPFLLSGTRLNLVRYSTLDEAKAAAQADFELRILSALEGGGND